MHKITVKILEEDSLLVEKHFFEYNSINNILSYLTSQDNCHVEYLDKYFQQAVEKNMELELYKREVSNKYSPNPNKMLMYSFDFDNNTIIYDIEEED